MKTLRNQRAIFVFLIIAAVAVSYGAITYVKLPRLLGIGRYTATVELPVGAGLYPNSVVTVRGVQVGQVEQVLLTETGAAAEIQIDETAQVPTASAVQIRSTSAVGEQYVNFEPASADGPFLGDGSVVAARQVQVPTPTSALLERANNLVAAVPQQKLRTTIDELAVAFRGSGTDLQRLLDSATRLQDAADADLRPTVGLLRDLGPVLATQQARLGDTRSFTRDLASFTGTLRGSDSDLRGALNNFPPLLRQFDATLEGLRPTLPTLLSDLTKVGQVARVYLPNIAQTVTILTPTLNASVGAVVNSPIPAASKIDFDLVVNDPPPCTQGFEVNRRSPSDLTPARPGTNVFCKVPKDSPQAVRGGRNYQCPPGSPNPGRAISASGCGLNFQNPREAAAATEAAIQTQLRVAAANPKTNAENPDRPPQFPDSGPNNDPDGAAANAAATAAADPTTGLFGVDGQGVPQTLGNAVPSNIGGWPGFLVNPLNLGRR